METLSNVQQAFNAQITTDPSFKEVEKEVSALRKGQTEIKATLDREVEQQIEFETRVQMEFDKGSRKFEKLESEIETMKDDFKKGLKEVIDTIHNKELSELRTEIKSSQDDKKLKREFWLGVLKTVLSAVVAGIVLFGLSKLGLTK